MKKRGSLSLLLALILLIATDGCGGGGSTSGGGGGGGNGGGGGGTQQQLQISTSSNLPGTLNGHAYSATLTAVNAKGALTWSIAPISATASFVDGLTIDPATGVLSGTANFWGTCGFTATVKDGTSTASKSFTITATSPLAVAPTKSVQLGEYSEAFAIGLDVQGGVQPLHYSILSGALPPGIRIDYSTGNILGSAFGDGTYTAMIGVSDSFTPAESGSQQLSITVARPQLTVAYSLPSSIPVNRPFVGTVVANGGVTPYHFALNGTPPPPGIGDIDPLTGKMSGTPTTVGYFQFTVNVTDSASPPKLVQQTYLLTVVGGLGRNDTVQTATPLQNGMYQLTLSPYIDPPDKAPAAFDQDYFKLASLSGATVTMQTFARAWNPNSPADTVLEIVDAAGHRMTNCQLQGDSSNTYTSSCISDDESSSNQDSFLQFKVPGSPSTPTTFYAHVFDWRGDSRPDMQYNFSVDGLVPPLSIQGPYQLPADRTLAYSFQLTAVNGTGTLTWSTTPGTLPPGLALSSGGLISGTATTDGSFPFTVQVSDTSTPPQVTTASFSIQVFDPVHFTTTPVLPDACVNQPYIYTLQASGGAPPLWFGINSNNWVPIFLDQATGVLSGTAGITGTYTAVVGVSDAANAGDYQTVSLTVKNCP